MKFTSAHVVHLAPSSPCQCDPLTVSAKLQHPRVRINNNNYTSGHSTVQGTWWSCKYIVVSARVSDVYLRTVNNWNKWMLQMDAGGECKCTHGVVCSGPATGASRSTVVLCRSIDQWRRLATYPTCTNTYTWYCTPYNAATVPTSQSTNEQQWLLCLKTL